MTVQRDIVLLPFPFSDLKQSKVRPVIVLSNDKYNKKYSDIVVVPLTSNLQKTDYDMLITNKNLEKGNLIADSRVKVDRIFSVEKKLIKMNIGKIDKQTFSKIRTLFSSLVS
ncbi:MAG: type II toxin-antitoxin system PemK/MazF family toxin [Nitrosopumilus sp.]|nr:type II toxin-antitoxin system PemK/MazF family toxin [Nitrosopumilus sp.]